MQRVTLVKDVTAALRAGHPWIYRRALAPLPASLQPGTLVRVHQHREPLAIGFADPDAPIAVRVLDTPSSRIDGAWVERRVRAALAVRAATPSLHDTDGMRLIHGENDFMPGLVVDRYASVAVMAFDGVGAAAFWRPYREAIATALAPLELCERSEAPGTEIEIREGRARFRVDVRRGQKTGFFLDQRDNRRRVAALAPGADVLNLFCYTGGFTIHAALAGAHRSVSVDQAAPAIEAARRNLAANDLREADHALVTGDVFAFLASERERARAYDIVVCDPPSFASSERARPKALAAYRRLNRMAMGAVAPGGVLVTASCSSHVSTADLLDVVAQAAAEAGRFARVTGVHGPGPDHPTRPRFPEGHYLSCLFVRLE